MDARSDLSIETTPPSVVEQLKLVLNYLRNRNKKKLNIWQKNQIHINVLFRKCRSADQKNNIYIGS